MIKKILQKLKEKKDINSLNKELENLGIPIVNILKSNGFKIRSLKTDYDYPDPMLSSFRRHNLLIEVEQMNDNLVAKLLGLDNLKQFNLGVENGQDMDGNRMHLNGEVDLYENFKALFRSKYHGKDFVPKEIFLRGDILEEHYIYFRLIF